MPPDLSQNPPDMAGCAGVVCDMGEQCVAGTMHGVRQLPRAVLLRPDVAAAESERRQPGTGTCNLMNLVCNGTICVNCGATGELCCQTVPPCNNGIDQCVMGTCQTPMSMPGHDDVGGMDMTSIGMDMALHPLDGGVSLGD